MRMSVNCCVICVAALVLVPVMHCSAENPDSFDRDRELMVARQIEARGVKNRRVLEAMRRVPRHVFVPEHRRSMAYGDYPLPIGEGQTISQPYIVAFMTEALELKPEDRVLEIGTGSGYQAAVLAEIAGDVYSVELIAPLADRARHMLDSLGYDNVHVLTGDGYKGWPEHAPYDAVIVTCAPENIPQALIDQLADGGRLIIPVGPSGAVQELVLGEKRDGRFVTREVMRVRFVPMVEGEGDK